MSKIDDYSTRLRDGLAVDQTSTASVLEQRSQSFRDMANACIAERDRLQAAADNLPVGSARMDLISAANAQRREADHYREQADSHDKAAADLRTARERTDREELERFLAARQRARERDQGRDRER